VSYETIFTTQKMDKKTSELGIFFAGSRLRYAVRTLLIFLLLIKQKCPTFFMHTAYIQQPEVPMTCESC